MKLRTLNDSYLNVSGNCYKSDFINLTYIHDGKINFDDSVMFLSQAQKDKLNNDRIKNYQHAAFIVKNKGVYSLVADIDIDDYKAGKIKTHELVIPDTVQGMLANFSIYNTETQPVLLIHKQHIPLATYVKTVTSDDVYQLGELTIYIYLHEKAQQLLNMYKEIETLYVADGHHRLYSTSILKHKETMLACLMDMNDVKIYPIHRIIRNVDAVRFDAAKNLFINRHMISEDSVLQRGVVKITYQDETLYVKLSNIADDEFWNNDVLRLNTQILTVAFRINDFSALSFVLGNEFDMGNYVLGQNDVLLEVYPVTPQEFIHFMDLNLMMPPKSTCFEPKFPSFLIMKKYK